ncbi:tRNA dihydrouridine synthase DusB [Longimonas halophila]|uniref:tRNA-dihydrouridine synthase n=1 Tax=Longimonas halophila TaxID=1469170 RepID=A0A2H3NMY5_9BACT|nr:tRNA dihydrouridine synthase DusB [Longimonas halophila]PEN07889.1 tRNA dihydrouridine synthase DusB [Longimonas halophila]
MTLGSLTFGDRPLFLAPMEDVSDPPFRMICKRLGADMLYSEFVSTAGLNRDMDDATQKLDIFPEERPIGIQVWGGEIDEVRRATPRVDAAEPDLIDINFGCPVRKIVSKDGGAGILRDLDKMERITEAVIEASTRPVTVKTRLGWDDNSIRILEVARRLEALGIAGLAVHARTRSQQYGGEARWEWLRRIKEEGVRSIPLIGNGDALDPEAIDAMFNETGVDAVMIGRGAIGNPWIFRDAKVYMETGEVPPRPSWEERVQVVAEHLSLKCEWLGERTGVLEMRKNYSGYFKGFRNASKLRHLLMQEDTKDGVLDVMLNFNPDASDIQLPAASLPTKTIAESSGSSQRAKPVNVKKAELPSPA